MQAGLRSDYQAITAPSRRPWLGAAVTLLALLLIWILISGWYRNVLIADQRGEVAASLARDNNALTVAIDRRTMVLQSLIPYILSHQSESEIARETEFALNWLRQNVSGVDYMILARDGRPHYVFPRVGNEALLNIDLLDHPAPELQHLIDRTIAERRIVLGTTDHAVSETANLVAYYAVFKDNEFWGLTALGLNFQPIIADAKLEQTQPHLEVTLRDNHGHAAFGSPAVFAREPVTYPVSALESGWVLAGAPVSSWDASIQDAFLPFQVAGLFIVGLFTVLAFLVLSQQSRLVIAVRQRTEALEQAQSELEERVQERTAELRLSNKELSAEMLERERIARQLRESERLYRTLITASPDAIIVVNQCGRIVFASATALSMFGCDYLEDLLGLGVLRGVWRSDWTRACERVRQMLAGQPLQDSAEFVLRDLTGRQFVGEISLASLHADDGLPSGMVSIVRDVTRRVEMREALRRANDELELRVQARTVELLRSTEALRKSEAKFRTIVEHSLDGITLVDESGLVQEWNRGQAVITGIPRAEAVGEHIWDLQMRLAQVNQRMPEHYQLVAEYGQQFLQTGQPPTATTLSERPILRPDGTTRIVQPLPSPIKTDSGYMIVNITRDVTDSKQAEEALRQSEMRFRTVADFTYDWEYWQGPDQSVIYMSPSCERTTGYSAEEFSTDPALLFAIIHPDDRARMVEHVHVPTDSGDLLPIDFRIIRRDGSLCWIAHVCRPVFDEQDRALGRRISNRDITGRKRAEESLREHEKIYRSIFETTAEGLAICTLDGLIIEANPAFCKMHGYEVGAPVGRRMVTFIHPTDRHVFAKGVKAVKDGTTYAAQAVNLRQDDQPFHVEIRVVGLPYYGQPHLLNIVRDVSLEVGAYMRLEQRVQERTHELSMLLEFSHSMTRTLEMQPLLRLILDQLRSVVDYTSASILWLNGKEFVMAAHQGPLSENDRRQLHVPLDTPLGHVIFDQLQPVIIADVQGDGAVAHAFQVTMGDALNTTLHYVRSWLSIPLVITDRIVGLLGISHARTNYFTQRHADLALAFANQAAMAMENARLYEQAQDLAAMQERQRLARDLHDSVSQTLFSASLAAQVLPRLWERQREEGQQCLDELGRLTRGALAEMRTLLVELRPNVLVESKLGDLLRQLAEAIISRTRVPVQVVTEGQAVLPPDVQVALYRIAQEALNNVAKHADANQAIIRLQYYPLEQPLSGALDNSSQTGVELSISDDGRGFSQTGISADHLGLGIMRERADAINAELMMESQIGCGTHIVARWPRA